LLVEVIRDITLLVLNTVIFRIFRGLNFYLLNFNLLIFHLVVNFRCLYVKGVVLIKFEFFGSFSPAKQVLNVLISLILGYFEGRSMRSLDQEQHIILKLLIVPLLLLLIEININ